MTNFLSQSTKNNFLFFTIAEKDDFCYNKIVLIISEGKYEGYRNYRSNAV